MLSENELAECMGVSRTPVREAILELTGVGIVEVYPQRGSRVALIDDLMVDEACFLRLQLEKGVVEQLSSGEYDLAPLAEILALQEFCLENGTSSRLRELDDAFHKHLFTIAGKLYCYSLMQSMCIHFNRVRSLTQGMQTDRRNVGEHRQLLQALQAGQAASASAIMETHLSHYRLDEAGIRAKHPEYFKNPGVFQE